MKVKENKDKVLKRTVEGIFNKYGNNIEYIGQDKNAIWYRITGKLHSLAIYKAALERIQFVIIEDKLLVVHKIK